MALPLLVGGLLCLAGVVSCGGEVAFVETDESAGGNQAGPSCDSIEGCCAMACDHAASLACFDGGPDSCECGAGDGPVCRAAWRDFLRCLVPELPSAVACFESDVALRCDSCTEARRTVDEACGVAVPCADF